MIKKYIMSPLTGMLAEEGEMTPVLVKHSRLNHRRMKVDTFCRAKIQLTAIVVVEEEEEVSRR